MENVFNEYGYEVLPCDSPLVKVKKYDEENVADIIIIFNKETKTIGGGLITVKAIQTLNDISHQYKVFREFQRDIKEFAKRTGYDII